MNNSTAQRCHRLQVGLPKNTNQDTRSIVNNILCLDRFCLRLGTRFWVSNVGTWLVLCARLITARKSRSQISIRGIASAIHSDQVYRQLESAADGMKTSYRSKPHVAGHGHGKTAFLKGIGVCVVCVVCVLRVGVA